MTTETEIANRALQLIGTRTNLTAANLANNDTNEARQINLVMENIRDDTLRMAPWNFAMKTENLIYITSAPGTPENTSASTFLWQPGQPTPPWAYEYQYPVDCLRAQFVIPSTQSGFASGVPITTAVTGGAPSYWNGPPAKFKVQNDQFRPVLTATVVNGGTGYTVGDILLGPGAFVNNAPVDNTVPPIGGPVQLLVTAAPGGVISVVEVLTQINGSDTPAGGSYFSPLPNPVSVINGTGSGATFNLTYGPKSSQRVILTNQEYAILTYVEQVTDVNVMDTLFQSAWSAVLGATIVLALTGDKKLANMLIGQANRAIEQARNPDGNEGLTVNDVTPDWIRVRGVNFDQWQSGPYAFDWGDLWAPY